MDKIACHVMICDYKRPECTTLMISSRLCPCPLYVHRPTDDIAVTDVSLIDFIPVKGKFAVFVPHTAGRYQTKRFRKTLCPLVERLVNSLMMHGRNNGKKL